VAEAMANGEAVAEAMASGEAVVEAMVSGEAVVVTSTPTLMVMSFSMKDVAVVVTTTEVPVRMMMDSLWRPTNSPDSRDVADTVVTEATEVTEAREVTEVKEAKEAKEATEVTTVATATLPEVAPAPRRKAPLSPRSRTSLLKPVIKRLNNEFSKLSAYKTEKDWVNLMKVTN